MSEVAASLRRQAERCRRLSATVTDREITAALLRMATELERRAEELAPQARPPLPQR